MSAQVAKLLLVHREAPAEVVRLGTVRLELALEPQPLALEDERLCVSVGQRMLHLFEEPLRGVVGRAVGERLDAEEQRWKIAHR